MKKVRWGILSTANIGIAKVIPAMQKSEYCEINAICSRNLETAKNAATKLGIPFAYGRYEEMLADSEIDAVYNPLPNHLHVEWTIKCLEAGKHVLCEKPIGLNFEDAEKLLNETKKYPDLKVMEAFMYRHHPQWQKVKELVVKGEIGEVKSIYSNFSYFNDDPNNIRNQADIGGGGLMDIGCYNISLSRFIFDKEPERVCGVMEYDSKFNTDIVTSSLMDFGGGKTANFTCATQMNNFQNVNIFGTKGRIEIEVPFSPSFNMSCRVFIKKGMDTEELIFENIDHYTNQGDEFSKAILNNSSVPYPLEDAVANMKVIDAIIKSSKESNWESI